MGIPHIAIVKIKNFAIYKWEFVTVSFSVTGKNDWGLCRKEILRMTMKKCLWTFFFMMLSMCSFTIDVRAEELLNQGIVVHET